MALVPSSDPRVAAYDLQLKALYNNRIKQGSVVKVAKTDMIIHVADHVALEVAHEKPSVWFSANPNHKPSVRIPTTELGLGALAPVVKSALANFQLTTEMALVYLKLFFGTIKSEKLTTEWKSYDRVIGAIDSELTPLSLLEVIDGEPLSVAHNTTEVVGRGETTAMALYILAIYRILRTTHAEHARLLQNRIGDLMKGYCQDHQMITYSIDGIKQPYSGWLNIPSYATMVAAFDMFMFKNKNHPFSTMRIATVASRFRDCAGLTSIHHLAKVLGYPACAMIGYWCMTESLGDDFINIFSGQEEIDTQDSYFPYQVDLQLTPKSSYSTTVNPTLYFFIHATGALLSSTRSANAIMNLDTGVVPVARLAIWVALIHSTSDSYERKIVSIDDVHVNDEDDDDENTVAITRPTTTDPKAWFNYLMDINFTFGPEDLARFEVMKKNLGENLREGSIGFYLSTFNV